MWWNQLQHRRLSMGFRALAPLAVLGLSITIAACQGQSPLVDNDLETRESATLLTPGTASMPAVDLDHVIPVSQPWKVVFISLDGYELAHFRWLDRHTIN